MADTITCPEVRPATPPPPCRSETFRYTTCELPPAVRIEWGCIHEHIGTGLVCPAHWEAIQNAPQWYCDACSKHGHDCPVIVREVPRA